MGFKLRAQRTQKGKKYIFVKPKYITNCINTIKTLNLSPIYLTVLPQGNSKYYMDNYDRFGDFYTIYLDLRELNWILDCMEGDYPFNEKLMDKICLKHLRRSKRSICFGISELEKVKLRIQNNQIVHSSAQMPNSVVVEGNLRPYQINQINSFQEQKGKLQIEYL